jgi:hypothetical protein
VQQFVAVRFSHRSALRTDILHEIDGAGVRLDPNHHASLAWLHHARNNRRK